MATNAKDVKDLELSHGFARAYREVDEEAMLAVLGPGARYRTLMPRGYTEDEGPEKLIAKLREFATKWTFAGVDAIDVELLTQNVLQTGRLVFVGQRLRLTSVAGDRTATMVMKYLLAIKDGRIELADELCTGLMPQV
jgi:hypothetical protein